MLRRAILASALAVLAADTAGAVETGLTIESWGDVYRHGDPAVQGWLRETFKLSASHAPGLFVRVAWMIEADTHGEISRDDLYDDDDRAILRSASRFRDLILGFRAGPATVELGKQRLTWGRTSFINATDNLTPRDWTDPLDEQRLSPWSARVSVEKGRAWGEAAVVPRYAPSRLPVLGGRWFAIDPGTVPNPAYPGAGPPLLAIEAAYGADEFPGIGWDTLQGALRAGWRGPRGEIAASWFRGFDDAPLLTATPGVPDLVRGTIPLRIDRSAARLEVAGLDGEVLAGSWIVRGEGAYFHYPAGERDGFFLYQVEGQWSRGSWLAIAGYGATIGSATTVLAPTSLDFAFLPALFLRASYGDATEWQVAADAVYGVDDHDGFVRLSGSYPLAGHLRAGGEASVLWGAPRTFFGRWRDNDRLRVFVTFSF